MLSTKPTTTRVDLRRARAICYTQRTITSMCALSGCDTLRTTPMLSIARQQHVLMWDARALFHTQMMCAPSYTQIMCAPFSWCHTLRTTPMLSINRQQHVLMWDARAPSFTHKWYFNVRGLQLMSYSAYHSHAVHQPTTTHWFETRGLFYTQMISQCAPFPDAILLVPLQCCPPNRQQHALIWDARALLHTNHFSWCDTLRTTSMLSTNHQHALIWDARALFYTQRISQCARAIYKTPCKTEHACHLHDISSQNIAINFMISYDIIISSSAEEEAAEEMIFIRFSIRISNGIDAFESYNDSNFVF